MEVVGTWAGIDMAESSDNEELPPTTPIDGGEYRKVGVQIRESALRRALAASAINRGAQKKRFE